ncbi:MAG: MFS transporter [Bacteroidia bacterium]
MNLNNTFRAFSNRNYALFFTGQSISQVGTWMQRTAVMWVIYTLTHSEFMLGFVIFAQQFPSFILSLFGGIVADRYNRHKILLITQTASMIQAVLLAILVWTGHVVIWEILSLSVILGIINAFDMPARQTMIHDMVDNKENIANALALNSAMVNMARLAGPALSGIVLQAFGAGTCFSLNALSFVAVLISLLIMKFPESSPAAVRKKVSSELYEGYQYVKHTPSIAGILIVLTTLCLFVMPYDTILPVFAKVIFKGDAATFGYISSCIGLGAILASLILASRPKSSSLLVPLVLSIALLGLGLMVFSTITSFPLSLPFSVLIGIGTLTPMTVCITIAQMEAAAPMRGRVMSFVALSYFGMLPLGSLLTGSLSQKYSAPLVMFIQGVIALLIALSFGIYQRSLRLKEKAD